jgi:hypothetical protein
MSDWNVIEVRNNFGCAPDHVHVYVYAIHIREPLKTGWYHATVGMDVMLDANLVCSFPDWERVFVGANPDQTSAILPTPTHQGVPLN